MTDYPQNDGCIGGTVTLQENGIVRDADGVIVGRMQKEVSRDQIVAAVAQGWCTSENEQKEMDPVLADAIVRNIVNLL
jgi:hypothetical protein